MAGQPHSNTLEVEVAGSPLPADIAGLLVSAWVDDNLNLPDLFVLSFRDPERIVLAKAGIEIGAAITLSVTSAARTGPDKLLSGEVTAVEAEFGPSGSFTVVRGFDHAHRLFRGKTSESYRNVTYSDVARLVARRVGLPTGTIDDSRTVHDHVAQGNVSDWQFLSGLAAEIGFEVAVVEGRLDFRRPTPSEEAPETGDHTSTDPLALVPGSSLLRFRSTVTSAEQVKEVVVRGWDPIKKQTVVGRAPAGTTSAEVGVRPDDLAGKFGSPVHSVEAPLAGQAEVDALAKALAEEIAGAMAEFEGVARGDAKLRAGKAVSLGLAGDPFDGRYLLTTTRHVFDPDEGYTTWFTASGRQERSLLGLTGGSGTAQTHSVPGVVSAIVTDVRDPENLCRVKVKFPAMSDSYETDWARTVQAGAGASRGAVNLPEVNDEVLVAFERGDIRKPYIVGGLYNGVDTPDVGEGLVDSANGAVKRRGFVSRTGHGLVFLDGDGDGGIALLTGDRKLRVSLNESTKTVKITGPGDVTVDAGGKVTVTAGDAMELSGSSITLKAKQGITLDAGGGELTGKGSGVDLAGKGSAKLKGATATVQGDSQAELKGGALASVSAAMVKIN
jgi:phage protein D/phage baseplate assembly protein gpV